MSRECTMKYESKSIQIVDRLYVELTFDTYKIVMPFEIHTLLTL